MVKKTTKEAKSKDEAVPETEVKDPYSIAGANYLKPSRRWVNKQRTLVLCSRGITHRYRHLMKDFQAMLPHHKKESKFEKKEKLTELNELMELNTCCNCIYLEVRKGKNLFIWVSQTNGPSAKFRVHNVHTMGEIKLSGNCLARSRPLLSFSKEFDEITHLKLLKGIFINTIGTPRNHPKSQPFFDHVVCFYYLDKKIWFRHYQICPLTENDENKPDRVSLTEIGPRFVLEVIRIFSSSFSGKAIYANPEYDPKA